MNKEQEIIDVANTVPSCDQPNLNQLLILPR
jgi:hypothetical protein